MYLEHFELKDHPFRLTPDTEFLFMSNAHARAKAYMDYTVWNRDGFVVITGEIGSGKTTLIQKLLSEFDENVLVAKVFQTQLNEVEFLQAVLVEFGLNPFNAKKVELIDMLNSFLIENFLKMKQLVLIVDDAHHLSLRVLEEIRMLSGLETQKEKLLHIVLVGQSELNALLESPELEQLLQRVRLRYHIQALSETEMREYIRHRLQVAGAARDGIFSEDCIPVIHKYSGGIPRLVNTLCDTALTCAFADGLTAVTATVINTAVEELQWLPYAKRVSRQRARNTERSAPESGRRLDEHGRLLQQISGKLEALDEMAPAMSSISGKLAHIEALLKSIADSLSGASGSKESWPRQKLK